MRIVSLLPSATEILYEIGAADQLVGRSYDSPPPPGRDDVPVLTHPMTDPNANGAQIDSAVRACLESGQSLFHLDTTQLARLCPDVILTQDTCRVCSIDLATVRRAVLTLDPSPRVLNCEPHTIEDIFDDMLRIGQAVAMPDAAQRAVTRRREQFFSAKDHANALSLGPRAVVLEWLNPLFIAGHWTPDLVNQAGAQYQITQTPEPSRQIPSQQLIDAMPHFLFVAPCGTDLEFARNEIVSVSSTPWWHQLPAVSRRNVFLLDGRHSFSRPSPALVDTFCLLVGLINEAPEIIPDSVVWSRLSDVEQLS